MVGLYIRTSTTHQDTSIQKKTGIDWCNQNGYDYILYEEQISGAESIENRTELKRMIDDILDNKIDKVWVIEHTRLARETSVSVFMMKLFHDRSVEYYVNGSIRSIQSPEEQLLYTISSAVSDYERKLIKERTKRGIHRQIDEGRRIHRKVTGYVKDGKTITIHPDESKMIQLIYSLFVQQIPTSRIETILIKRRMYNRNGNILRRKNIARLVKNPIYAGLAKSSTGELVKHQYYPPIIDRETYEAAVVEAERRNQSKIKHKHFRKEGKYAVSGLFKCEICSTPYVVRHRKRFGGMQPFLESQVHKDECGRGYGAFHVQKLELLIDSAYLVHHSRSEVIHAYVERQKNEVEGTMRDNDEAIENIQKRIDDLQLRHKRLVDSIEQGIPIESIAHRMKELQSKIDDHKSDIQELEREKAESSQHLIDMTSFISAERIIDYLEGSEIQKKHILRDELKSATVDEKEVILRWKTGDEDRIDGHRQMFESELLRLNELISDDIMIIVNHRRT